MNTPMADEKTLDPHLQRLLEQAYPGPDCPAPEAYLIDADLSAAERARNEAHAQTCPACAAERALARGFEANAELSADGLALVEQMRAQAPWRAPAMPTGNVHRFGGGRSSGRRRHLSFLAIPLAMAAALVLAFGALLRLGGPAAPPIGAPGTGVAMRGSEIEVVAPVGEIALPPDALRFGEVPGAASYRVSILGVEGEELWSDTVPGSPAILGEAVMISLHPAVLYRWQVEALDKNGSRVAWSKATPFRLNPQPRGRD